MADSVIDSNKENAHGTKKKKDAFTIEFGNGCKSSLQESFLKFKKAKQREIAKQKKVRRARLRRQKNPKFQEELRKKFINQAKKYFGVPYARKYWSKDTEEYKSKLFLDCCGLVRQCVRDLAKDFGFVIGPWNQAYMYDTLPHTIKESEMKPGDLVFMSGTYVNPKSTNQKHFMTHVEIWLGEGPKTIGARWNNGKVQIWDSYQFNAKSFTNTVYHFKSIDTWLRGICKNYCPEHKWKRSKFKPGKKSVFNQDKQKKDQDKPTEGTDEQSNEQTEQQPDEGADEVVNEPDDDPMNEGVDDDEDEDDDLDDLDDDVDDGDDLDDFDDVGETEDDNLLGVGSEVKVDENDEMNKILGQDKIEKDIGKMEQKKNINDKDLSGIGKSLEMKKTMSDRDLKGLGKKQNLKKNLSDKDLPQNRYQNLVQSETSLIHEIGPVDEKKDFRLIKNDMGGKNKRTMKAGCDKLVVENKSSNALGLSDEDCIDNNVMNVTVDFSSTSIEETSLENGGN